MLVFHDFVIVKGDADDQRAYEGSEREQGMGFTDPGTI